MPLMVLAVIAILATPAPLMAQRGSGNSPGHASPPRDTVPRWTIPPRSGPASEGWPRDPLPTWSIPSRHGRLTTGVPLPQIGLPLPPVGLQPHVDRNRAARHHRGRTFVPWASWPMVYVLPPFVEPYVQPAPAPPPVAIEQPPSVGRLILEVLPSSAQVFVDGY